MTLHEVELEIIAFNASVMERWSMAEMSAKRCLKAEGHEIEEAPLRYIEVCGMFMADTFHWAVSKQADLRRAGYDVKMDQNRFYLSL